MSTELSITLKLPIAGQVWQHRERPAHTAVILGTPSLDGNRWVVFQPHIGGERVLKASGADAIILADFRNMYKKLSDESTTPPIADLYQEFVEPTEKEIDSPVWVPGPGDRVKISDWGSKTYVDVTSAKLDANNNVAIRGINQFGATTGYSAPLKDWKKIEVETVISKYVPQVGDRIRLSTWGNHEYLDVTRIEDGRVHGMSNGPGTPWLLNPPSSQWEKIEMEINTERYLPEVGHRVTNTLWPDNWYVDVDSISLYDGKMLVFSGIDQQGNKGSHYVDDGTITWQRILTADDIVEEPASIFVVGNHIKHRTWPASDYIYITRVIPRSEQASTTYVEGLFGARYGHVLNYHIADNHIEDWTLVMEAGDKQEEVVVPTSPELKIHIPVEGEVWTDKINETATHTILNVYTNDSKSWVGFITNADTAGPQYSPLELFLQFTYPPVTPEPWEHVDGMNLQCVVWNDKSTDIFYPGDEYTSLPREALAMGRVELKNAGGWIKR